MRRIIRQVAADLAIVGFGAAGSAAAMEAAALGADVLIVECAPDGREGGNTRVSSQGFLSPNDPARASSYVHALDRRAELNPARVMPWAEEACQNAEWLARHGIATEDLPSDDVYAEYPELPGSDCIVKRRVSSGTGLDLWGSLKSCVQRYRVRIEYGLQATDLAKSSTGRVNDILCKDREGAVTRVHARRGVILASGGYAASPRQLQALTPELAFARTAGCPHNRGDAIRMATALGARLSGLRGAAGPYLAFLPPGYDSTVPLEPLMPTSGTGGWFAVIDAVTGRKFNYIANSRHGFIATKGGWRRQRLPMAAYFICDNELISRLALVADDVKARTSGWCRAVEGLRWSPDNSRERRVGWVAKVNAHGLSRDTTHAIEPTNPTDKQLLMAWQLEPTRAIRSAQRKYGPLFTVPLVQSLLNTQGGPDRDEFCRVLDRHGLPIPGLYSAGELGSIFPDLYQGSGNLADCLISGRVAARVALGKK